MSNRQIQEELERKICSHPYATLSVKSKGRIEEEKEDEIRVCFERDGHRILHSLPFRRLKHKTQVFFLPENDHICTRLEHALHVSSISCTIAKCLGLNIELVDAIAKGHDIGHAPFGHCGESILKDIIEDKGLRIPFEHEIHGLRVVDRLALIPGRRGPGLNLTFEVRDGIACHYGEEIEEKLEPDLEKSPSDLDKTVRGRSRPATLEGCVVRFADKVAYLGRDMEDAITVGLISRDDLPNVVKKRLGNTNGKIIGTFMDNILKNNKQNPKAIMLDTKIRQAMQQLLDFNRKRIYGHPEVDKYKRNAERVITLLFYDLLAYLDDKHLADWLPKKSEVPMAYYWLHDYIKYRYLKDENPAQIVLDYISGMTDNFAVACFEELFIPKSIV